MDDIIAFVPTGYPDDLTNLWLERIIEHAQQSGLGSPVLVLELALPEAVLDRLVTGGAGALLVHQLDHLGPSLGNLRGIDLQGDRQPLRLISVSEGIDTDNGIKLVPLIESLARLAQRPSQAHRRAGRAPYGYELLDGELQPVEAQQEVIQRILSMRQDGCTFQVIADILTDEGVPSQRGGAWSPQTVKNIQDRSGSYRDLEAGRSRALVATGNRTPLASYH
jgi:hypothetical protein